MKISASIHCTFPDDRHDAFMFALSEKLQELVFAGWDISLPVFVQEITDGTIRERALMLSNKEETNGRIHIR